MLRRWSARPLRSVFSNATRLILPLLAVIRTTKMTAQAVIFVRSKAYRFLRTTKNDSNGCCFFKNDFYNFTIGWTYVIIIREKLYKIEENMASNKEYLDFILEQLSELSDITYRQMMGEYIVYYRGKIVGGIYDDRFLVKPVKSAISLMPDATYELPYEGAKQMLVVDNVDSKGFLKKLFEAMYDELPTPKMRK